MVLRVPLKSLQYSVVPEVKINCVQAKDMDVFKSIHDAIVGVLDY